MANRSKIKEEKILAYNKIREFFTTRNFAIRRPLDEFSRGRSMVEMLGVLAIIGVLSVGGLAGYQKAMMKYKLNIQASSFEHLFFNTIELKNSIANSFNGTSISGKLFYQLGIIPDGMIYSNGIFDIFNNRVDVDYYALPSGIEEYNVNYKIKNNNDSLFATDNSMTICQNIISVAKEFSNDLSSIQIRSYKEDSHYNQSQIFGNRAGICATENKQCLKDASLIDIQNLCRSCNSKYGCRLYIFINLRS